MASTGIQPQSLAESLREQIRQMIGGGALDELVVDEEAVEAVELVVQAAREAGKPVRVIPELPAEDLPGVRGRERWVRTRRRGQSCWLFTVPRPPGWQLWLKRFGDIAAAALLIILLSPLLIGLAVAVRMTSAGPILYRWKVVGRNGRPFTGYKFRTMFQNAERMKITLLDRNEMTGPVFKLANDPRVTRVGRWLRKYSLDELPQLWNVIKGDMSLVGPRPLFRDEYQQLALWQLRRLSVTPGMTCLWQVSGRNAISDFSEWARLDLAYIDRWSLWLDARILVRTAAAVIKGTGC